MSLSIITYRIVVTYWGSLSPARMYALHGQNGPHCHILCYCLADTEALGECLLSEGRVWSPKRRKSYPSATLEGPSPHPALCAPHSALFPAPCMG